ncbi:MAG: universal stress protein [Nocardioidaceae bacterium]
MSEVATELDISGGIAVGYDGSENSGHAARWAAEWAQKVGCDVHAVRTWTLSTAPRPASWEPGYVPPMADFEGAVLEALQHDIEALKLPDDVTVLCHVVHGAAGRRLVEVSERVELLVLASRGRGGFRELVLGSTADQVVRHAHCPVVVIPVVAQGEPASPDERLLKGE